MYLSVDPGMNVGIATFRSDGTDVDKKVLRLPAFLTFLHNLHSGLAERPNLKLVIVYEDFTLRYDKALNQTGSDMPASRAIGALEFLQVLLGDDKCTLEKVSPRVLNAALKWSGYANLANKGRSFHPPDDVVAYAHGVKYLIDKGVRKHPIFESE